MVFLSRLLLVAPRGLQVSHKTKFLDRIRVYVKGGTGGQGYPKYGGLGGDGGNVYFVAGESENLYEFANEYPKKRFLAGKGSDSKRLMLLGTNGENLEIVVPHGVVLSLDNGAAIGELNKPGERITVAKGGDGGGPNNSFRASAGEARSVTLDLKLLADVGFVGFPNAGKSTLLKALSRAKPKIADYPFTTIRPQLGAVCYEDGRRLTVADLPGLIEGAHLNVGMGHYFLKHVERTKLLLVIVDVQGFVLNDHSAFRNAFETVILLNKELEMYKPALLDKPQVLLINKMDTTSADRLLRECTQMLDNIPSNLGQIPEELRPSRLFKFHKVLPISAMAQENLEEVKTVLRQVIDETNLPDDKDINRKLTDHVTRSNTELTSVKLT